jgi:NAD(P)-dependent dehydrogenase (short-subunit alcohol dehydrogenase family)
MSLEGKVIALTGAGQGIGLATARILASRGATVSLADANPETLAEVEKEFKENNWPILVATVDVRNRNEVDNWINTTVQTFGRLDGAANIAGTVGRQWGKAPVAEIDDDDWNLVMGVNVTGKRQDSYYFGDG